MMKSSNKPVLAGVALLLLAVLLGENAMSLEKPDYEVVFKAGDIEYRQYAAYLVAETVIEDRENYKSAGNEGFRRLFRYITGGNQSQQDIAMTAPVAQSSTGEKIDMTAPVQQSGSESGWRVSFMLPKKYTLDTAPVPSDTRVQVKQVPGRLMAVFRYSGRWTSKNFEKGKDRLEKAIDFANVEPLGQVETAMYDPPFKPPFMRRNEVMVEVRSVPSTTRTTRIEKPASDYAIMTAGLAE